jgi:putative DNA primase/helicase
LSCVRLPYTGAAPIPQRVLEMSAAEIAAALGGRREGREWRCRCPLHGGRSLLIRDEQDTLLVKCWGGCDTRNVLAELRRMGLCEGRQTVRRPDHSRDHDNDGARRDYALRIWRESWRGEGSPAATYLASRGIKLDPWPPSLRFHPRCPRPRDENGNTVTPLPAMVALVECIGRGPVGIHCTYLKPDGTGKAEVEPNKAMFGPVGGGAVRFGTPVAGQELAVAEGIESALSVAIACSMPVWAALSAGGIEKLILPPEVTRVVICADNDSNGVGQRGAHKAAKGFLREGRSVRIAVPPVSDTDFNDLIIRKQANE